VEPAHQLELEVWTKLEQLEDEDSSRSEELPEVARSIGLLVGTYVDAL
jgi:hypothetical protein